MTPEPPELPGFLIERFLGEGAHGKVWLARETSGLARLVALKVFSAEHREKFERELELVRRVEELRQRERAPEIVQALGTGEHQGSCWIALEYLEQGSLADVVARDGPLPVERAVLHAREAGRALARLHAEGLFHRDVKPANLLLGRDGRVRLADFGLSRSLSGSLSAAGSPAFAAPEVIAGKPVDGRLADVYSLGATLAFLVTGETILPGRPDVFALERRGVPRPLQKAIVAATAADPAERVASIEVFVASLDAPAEDGERSPPHAEKTKSRTTPASSDEGAEAAMNLRVGHVVEEFEQRQRFAPRTLKRAILACVCAVLAVPSLMASLGVVTMTARQERLREQEHAIKLARHRAEAARSGEPVPSFEPARDPSSDRLPLVLLLLLPPLVFEVGAVALGVSARRLIRTSGGTLTGLGWANAALWIAGLNVVGPTCLGLPALLVLARPAPAAPFVHEVPMAPAPAVPSPPRDRGGASTITHDGGRYAKLTTYGGDEHALVGKIAAALTAIGERPSEFYVRMPVRRRVDDSGKVILSLWHRSAFDAAGAAGNPGGKCRDAVIDETTGKVEFLRWQ